MAEMNSAPQTPMFSEPPQERGFPVTAVAIAAMAIVILVAVLVMLGERKPAPPPSNPAYVPNLVISGIEMSQSDTATGGKQTYIDGHIANRGTLTVTGVTVQAGFLSDQGAPQVETESLRLVSMRDPYIDTRPVSEVPLAPGAQADFRLIFEDIQPGWNQQPPQIIVSRVTTREK
jgi:hypothetical protein